MENPFEMILIKLQNIERRLADIEHTLNQPPKPEKLIYLPDEAAEFLGLSKSTLYRLTSTNAIPFLKKGGRIWFEKGKINKMA